MRDFLGYYFSPRRFIGDVQRAAHTVRIHVLRSVTYTVEEMRGLSVLRWITSSSSSSPSCRQLVAARNRNVRYYFSKYIRDALLLLFCFLGDDRAFNEFAINSFLTKARFVTLLFDFSLNILTIKSRHALLSKHDSLYLFPLIRNQRKSLIIRSLINPLKSFVTYFYDLRLDADW